MLDLLTTIMTVAETDAGKGGWFEKYGILIILGVFLVIMILFSVLPQRKRKKQAQEMINSLQVGAQVKTIGGFVGVIKAIDDATNTLIINIGRDDNELLVTLDRSAIYTVMTPGQQPKGAETQKAVAEEAKPVEEVVSADDAEEAAKAEAKRADKAAKKAERAAERAAKKAAKAEASAEATVVEGVEPTTTAEVVEAEVVSEGSDSAAE